jgi:hypothetical protein
MSDSVDAESMLRVDPQRAKLLAENLGHLYEQIHVSGGRKVRSPTMLSPLLLADSNNGERFA